MPKPPTVTVIDFNGNPVKLSPHLLYKTVAKWIESGETFGIDVVLRAESTFRRDRADKVPRVQSGILAEFEAVRRKTVPEVARIVAKTKTAKRRKRGHVDMVALARDMDKRGFKAVEWAKEKGVHSTAVRRAIDRIRGDAPRKKTKTQVTATPPPKRGSVNREALRVAVQQMGPAFSPVKYAREIGAKASAVTFAIWELRKKGLLPPSTRKQKKGGAERPRPTADLTVT